MVAAELIPVKNLLVSPVIPAISAKFFDMYGVTYSLVNPPAKPVSAPDVSPSIMSCPLRPARVAPVVAPCAMEPASFAVVPSNRPLVYLPAKDPTLPATYDIAADFSASPRLPPAAIVWPADITGNNHTWPEATAAICAIVPIGSLMACLIVPSTALPTELITFPTPLTTLVNTLPTPETARVTTFATLLTALPTALIVSFFF